jgi:hypothetical protein
MAASISSNVVTSTRLALERRGLACRSSSTPVSREDPVPVAVPPSQVPLHALTRHLVAVDDQEHGIGHEAASGRDALEPANDLGLG